MIIYNSNGSTLHKILNNNSVSHDHTYTKHFPKPSSISYAPQQLSRQLYLLNPSPSENKEFELKNKQSTMVSKNSLNIYHLKANFYPTVHCHTTDPASFNTKRAKEPKKQNNTIKNQRLCRNKQRKSKPRYL
jgi:hypothetical protein